MSALGHKPRRRSGRGPVYVRNTSNRVEILWTAVKDAKCHEPTYAVQQIWSLLDHLVGACEHGGGKLQAECLGGF